MKLKLTGNKLYDYTERTIDGGIECTFKKNKMADALIAVANKVKELGDQYGKQKIIFDDTDMYGNSIDIYWYRKLTDQEKTDLKILRQKEKARALKTEIKDVKKRAKELGIIK